MADKRKMPEPIIVDVQGVGPVSFPAGTTGAQIESWVLNHLKAQRPPQTWGEWGGNLAARVGGGIAGGVIGSLAGPVGTFAGTATGAAMGDEWAQSREVAQGVRESVNPLEMLAAGATAPIPGATLKRGAPLLRQVPRALAAGVSGAAASSAGMQLAESGTVDPWRTAMETGRGAVLGGVIGLGVQGGLRGAQSKAAQKLVRDETGAIRVYHGSPHDFDQFSTEKIGTGEGAQAYGHGLYFAEHEGVAKGYRDALSPMEVEVRGVPGVTWEHLTAGMKGVKKGSLDAARASGKFTPEELDAMAFMSDSDIDTSIRGLREQAEMTWRGADARQLWSRRADTLERLKAETTIKPGGKMYEVNIDADPEQFLDWDKPLSAQPKAMQDFARKHLLSGEFGRFSDHRLGHDPTGEQLYREMQNRLEALWQKGAVQAPVGPEGVAGQLKDMGIPGIKYLDQGSRITAGVDKLGDKWFVKGSMQPYATQAEAEAAAEASGGVTRNYVVADDKLVSILRKYGLLPFVPLSQVGRPQRDEDERRRR
jgi:hypothetical protein